MHQTTEFQGILTLNTTLVDQLYRYLEARESKTCQAIMNIIEMRLSEPETPLFLPGASTPLKVTETVDLVGKKIRQSVNSRQSLTGPSDWRSVADKISRVLWDYLEVLESCVTELFQRLDQVSVEEWGIELAHIADGIKDMLLHRLDDLDWATRRLEHQLYEYRWAGEARTSNFSMLKKACLFWQSHLDGAIRPNLEKCSKYLGFRWQKFSDQYERYIDIHTDVELVVDKFSEYQVFNGLETETQDKFKKIYRLVRLWQLNNEERALPRSETVRALRHAMSPERALSVFREYNQQLWRSFYEKSRMIKAKPWELSDRGNVSRMIEQIDGFRIELNTLSSTVLAYHDFLLKSEPGLRTKSRAGLTDWALGPERHETRQFSLLNADLHQMDEMMVDFSKSMDGTGIGLEHSVADIDPEVQSVLHEMAQPLISRPNMVVRSQHLVTLLKQLNLISNSDKATVDYVGLTLNKAMRADWQYNTLFDQPAFHQLYTVYRGIVGPIDDRTHLNRMQKFKRLIQQLDGWVSTHDTPRHAHEIEVDLSDMKGYLQDFLANAQRLAREDDSGKEERYATVAQQLLEYRYMFGSFFHRLLGNSAEARMLRKQLLFVDQYFEAVETTLTAS